MVKTFSKDVFTLEVSEKNVIAINLYKSYGFESVGIRKKYYEGISFSPLMLTKLTCRDRFFKSPV